MVLKNKMNSVFKDAEISVQYNWKLGYEMDYTHIYYITQDFFNQAILLAKWLPGQQYIIDYKNQRPTTSPDLKPHSRMIGLEKGISLYFSGMTIKK